MNLNATLFAQFVVFIVLAIFTAKVVWPPLVKVLDERAKRIQEGLTAADRSKQEMIAVQKHVQTELAKAKEKKVKNVFWKLKHGHRKLRMTSKTMLRARLPKFWLKPELRPICRSNRQENNFVQKLRHWLSREQSRFSKRKSTLRLTLIC